jgi:hypothetical protein
MVEINPRLNGVHSFAEALKAFKRFHDNPEDVFALKDSILRSHHALETLFKYVLYSYNPVLLLDGEIKVERFLKSFEKARKGELITELDDLTTANLVEIVDRLRRFSFLKSLSEEEYRLFRDAVRDLSSYRNKLQHFGLSADPDVVGRILGNVLPRTLEVLQQISYYHPLIGELPMEPLINDLQKILPEASEIIDFLRRNYDRLVLEAINYFKNKTFENQTLRLKIIDHGMVGAPPYFPELSTEGFLNLKYGISELMESIKFQRFRQINELPYSSSIKISQPTFVQDQMIPHEGVAKGALDFNARITLHKANSFVVLPNAAEKLAFLRNIVIEIRVFVEYEAKALMTEHHFDCEKILKANGQLKVKISAVPKGYRSDEAEIVGKYDANLNEENAPFRLHSFLNPDSSLKEDAPRHLEWIINTKGNIEFS